MDTSRIESLLEMLIEKQDEIVSRLESLESSVSNDLSALSSNLESGLSLIHNELNWWTDGPTLAKQVLQELELIRFTQMNTNGL